MAVRWWVCLALVACGKGDDPACGDLQCPVGTAPHLVEELSEAIDLDLDPDPGSYAGEIAFRRVSEGSCELVCATLQPCGAGTFPVITAECFTCAFIDGVSGEVDQAACDP